MRCGSSPKTVRRILLTFATCAVWVSGCVASHSPATSGSNCRAELPGFVRGAQPGELTAWAAGAQVGSAVRDSSLTLVALCATTGSMGKPPDLVDDGRSLRGAGGVLSQSNGGWVNYVVYPSTRAEQVTLWQQDAWVATVRFPAPSQHRCAMTATPGTVTLSACEGIIVVDWRLPLELDPGQVEIWDGRVTEAGSLQDLGFYFFEASGEAGRPVIHFGFRRPVGSDVVFRMDGVYLRRSGGVDYMPYRYEEVVHLAQVPAR